MIHATGGTPADRAEMSWRIFGCDLPSAVMSADVETRVCVLADGGCRLLASPQSPPFSAPSSQPLSPPPLEPPEYSGQTELQPLQPAPMSPSMPPLVPPISPPQGKIAPSLPPLAPQPCASPQLPPPNSPNSFQLSGEWSSGGWTSGEQTSGENDGPPLASPPCLEDATATMYLTEDAYAGTAILKVGAVVCRLQVSSLLI